MSNTFMQGKTYMKLNFVSIFKDLVEHSHTHLFKDHLLSGAAELNHWIRKSKVLAISSSQNNE